VFISGFPLFPAKVYQRFSGYAARHRRALFCRGSSGVSASDFREMEIEIGKIVILEREMRI
jgi:hypothetical protein